MKTMRLLLAQQNRQLCRQSRRRHFSSIMSVITSFFYNVLTKYSTIWSLIINCSFCRFSAFTVPDLEKKPTADVYRPPTGALTKVLELL